MLPEVNDILNETISGLIGGLIVGVFTILYGLIKNEMQKRKFPVAGEYLTYYEDIVNRKKILVSAKSTLKQKGHKITGTTWIDNNQSWTLDGRILGTGHIAGVYSADSLHDDGVGAFYLKITPNNDLEGIWSGYDNVNKKTSSGRYIFKKIENISIVPAKSIHIAKILDLATDLFGYGYVEDIESYIRDTEAFVYVAMYEDKIIGFASGKLCEKKSLLDLIHTNNHHFLSPDILHSSDRGNLGLIKTVGIEKTFQGRGYGTILLLEIEKALKNIGINTLIVSAWVDKDTTNIGGVLKQNQYNEMFYDNSYWKEDCEKNKFFCPSKTGNTCQCGARFYKKSI
jgi:GNAT superfamily N-acetyltransferase